MENQAVTTHNQRSSGTWWKVLLGIGGIGLSWFVFSSFKAGKDALPNPDDMPDDDANGYNQTEQYEIDLWKYGILKSGKTWPQQIATQAKALGKTFQQHLNDIAIAKYVEKGHNGGKIEEYFQQAIRKYKIKVRQSRAWMDKIVQKAKDNNITVDEQMIKAAIWSILNELMKPYVSQKNQNQQNQQFENPHPHGEYTNGYNGIGAVKGISL